MTEELEKKLNELLGLKRQLEEITEEKRKATTSSIEKKFQKAAKSNRIVFYLSFLVGLAFFAFGLTVLLLKEEVVIFNCSACIIIGLIIMTFAKIRYTIYQSLLTILLELKQFELRITEMLKK